MRDYLLRLLKYGQWADTVLLDVLQNGAPEEALRLFEHVIAAQELWLRRVTGGATDIDIWARPAQETWRQRLDRTGKGWTEVVAAHDAQQHFSYRTTGGAAFSTALSDIVTHLAIHGQHHRAQIASALRQAGTPPPPLDYIVFIRSGDPSSAS